MMIENDGGMMNRRFDYLKEAGKVFAGVRGGTLCIMGNCD